MLCKCVNIHPSVYYYNCNKNLNSYEESNKILDVKIKESYDKSKGRYGSPKITKDLESQGMKVSQKRVARRMKIIGLRSIIIKKYNHAGSSKCDNTKEYTNILEQDFFAEKPSIKWGGDITYIYTIDKGWTYLAIVMDLYDLKVVGWSYGTNMTDSLVIDAFNKALTNRGLNKEGIFHSDRGSQYTSNNNAILKKEEVNLNTYKTFEDARMAIFEYIESWYNNQRIHGSLDYITPNMKYNNYISNIAIA